MIELCYMRPWSHECKVWYFVGEERPNAQEGEKITVNLATAWQGVTQEELHMAVEHYSLTATVYDRMDFLGSYKLICRDIKHGNEVYEAEMLISQSPNPMDSVRFVKLS